jgi:hypothetical protein
MDGSGVTNTSIANLPPAQCIRHTFPDQHELHLYKTPVLIRISLSSEVQSPLIVCKAKREKKTKWNDLHQIYHSRWEIDYTMNLSMLSFNFEWIFKPVRWRT